MAFKEVSSLNAFTNRVYSESPEPLKEAYRSGLKLKETASLKLKEVSSLKIPETPSLENVGSALQETVTSTVSKLKETGLNLKVKAEEAAKETLGWLGDTFDAAQGWLDQKVEEYGPVVEEKLANAEENITRAFSAETAVRTMATASPLFEVLPVNISKFSEYLAKEGDIEIKPEDFSSKDLEFLREKAREAIEKGAGKFTYETWGSTEGSILSSEAIKKSLMGDSNARMATLIGQTADGNVRVEDNRIIVEDVYDFNPGPRADKMKEAIKLREEGKEEEAQRLSEEALEGLTYFGQVRVWANVLGAPQGEGTRYKLDLGPYKEYKGTTNLKDDAKAKRGFGRTSPMSGLVTPGE